MLIKKVFVFVIRLIFIYYYIHHPRWMSRWFYWFIIILMRIICIFIIWKSDRQNPSSVSQYSRLGSSDYRVCSGSVYVSLPLMSLVSRRIKDFSIFFSLLREKNLSIKSINLCFLEFNLSLSFTILRKLNFILKIGDD